MDPCVSDWVFKSQRISMVKWWIVLLGESGSHEVWLFLRLCELVAVVGWLGLDGRGINGIVCKAVW